MIAHEWLDHRLVPRQKQLNDLERQFVEYFHGKRPHQGLAILPFSGSAATSEGKVVVRERLAEVRQAPGGVNRAAQRPKKEDGSPHSLRLPSS